MSLVHQLFTGNASKYVKGSYAKLTESLVRKRKREMGVFRLCFRFYFLKLSHGYL